MMKKKLLALLLAISMVASGASVSTVYAEDVVLTEEDMSEENTDENNMSVDSTVEESESVGEPTEESTEGDVVSDEQLTDAGEEDQAEEENTEESSNSNYEAGYVTTMDENGNVYEVVAEDGDASEIATSPRARSMSGKIVNFNTKGSAVTNYTEYETGTSGYTCGAYGADAAYLGIEDDKVKFMLGGVIGLVSADEVQLVDVNDALSISYYYVADSSSSGSRLYHYITTNVTVNSYATTLDNGKAPSYLKAGTKYYSYDGHYFYTIDKFSEMLDDYNNGVRTNSVNPSSPYYNYFQYLPFRSQSEYSASELNAMVNERVTETSKMLNLGMSFVNYQNTYGTNALLMVGIAANESNWGKSNIAQTKNNLFGLNAVDSSPGESANYYSDVETCVKDFSETYLSKQYLNPSDWKCYGAFLGNKGSGMNVKYASDPYWGEKAANVAYSLDKNNGNKDYSKYTIGIKDVLNSEHTGLNIRKEATTSSTILYKTKLTSQHAFLILDKETNYSGFYKIQSEPVLNSGRTAIDSSTGVYSFDSMYTYASTSYVTIVSTGTNSSSSDVTVDTGNVETITVPSGVSSILTVTPYIESAGWLSAVGNGVQAGKTTGYSLEGIKFTVNGVSNLGIEYSAHVSNVGWQDYVSNGALAGTTDTGENIEALKIRLTGTASDKYSIYYRAYVTGSGWQDFVSSDDIAGTTGKKTSIQAVQVIILAKAEDIATDNKSIISYSTYIPTIGWGGSASENGEQSGTVGMSYGIQSLKINTNLEGLGVEYTTHIPNVGWQDWVADGEESKVSNDPKRIEAIRIKLTGTEADNYDIYYRTHVAKIGWLDWAKNGEAAGSTGYSYQIEAIQIVVVAKGSSAPGSTTTPLKTYKTQQISYTTYVNTKGWQSTVTDGAIGGTTGKSLALGAIKISLVNAIYSGSVQYSGHVQDIGWQSWKADGAVSGVTTGKRYEAIKIKLTDEMAEYYDIYYRAHVSKLGWLGWAKNGEAAGSAGYSYPMEAIQIKLVKKGEAAPGSTSNCYVEKGISVSYSTHVQNIGWQSFVSDGATAGTSGKSLRLEAIKIKLQNQKYTGNIVYSTHVQNIGWQSSVMNGAISGTSGKSLRLEAIRINLTGELAEHYDIYYRVHVQNFGWLGWAKNGASAGSAGYSYRLEGIQIKLVEKGGSAPGSTANPFYEK